MVSGAHRSPELKGPRDRGNASIDVRKGSKLRVLNAERRARKGRVSTEKVFGPRLQNIRSLPAVKGFTLPCETYLLDIEGSIRITCR